MQSLQIVDRNRLILFAVLILSMIRLGYLLAFTLYSTVVTRAVESAIVDDLQFATLMDTPVPVPYVVN